MCKWPETEVSPAGLKNNRETSVAGEEWGRGEGSRR